MSLVRKVTRKIGSYRIRTLAVASIQRLALLSEDAASIEKLILFLVPSNEFFAGGILSIFSLYRLSRSMEAIHGARVLMCFFPGEARPVFRYKKFKNEVLIYPFNMVLKTCHKAQEMLIHVPAYAFEQIISNLGDQYLRYLRDRYNLKINILNQNILMMPDVSAVRSLQEIIPDLTCTTAHPSYCTPEQRQYWGVPMHHLPAWFYPDDAPSRPFETKRDLMIVSPDPSPSREGILDTIAVALPKLEIQVIQDMPFDKYVALEKEAKWSLTFGEGMDAYFMGTFLRGGISFAVYNDFFFTADYQGFRTVYPSYAVMQQRIVDDIRSLNSKDEMEGYNAQVRPLLDGTWGPNKTRIALESFYRRELTLP